MEMTLAEAATAVKMTKQGLLNAINKGRLSAVKDVNGQWKVDSAELMRVYPAAKPMTSTRSTDLTAGGGDLTTEVAVLRAKLDAAEARANRAERLLDAANERVDVLLRALPVGQTPTPTQDVAKSPSPETQSSPGFDESGPGDSPGHAEAPTRKKRGFWRFIFGGADNGEKA